MKTEEIIGAASGGAVGSAAGVGGAVAAVSTAGSVAGLSAAGFTSGLAAIGAGSMFAGAIVATGGVVVFDEYALRTYGESNAVDEYFKGQSIRLRTLPWANTPSAYLIKEKF